MVTHYGQNGRPEEITYSVWSIDSWEQLDWRGHVIDGGANPYGVLPFIPLWDHGFSETDIYEIVLSLSVRDFVHSVSENGSNKIWQDVYKIVRNDVHLFIKFKIVSIGEEELLVLSFHGSIFARPSAGPR